jgi:signal transduction histidine kinase
VSRRLARYAVIGALIVMAALVVLVLGIAHTALRRANRELGSRAEALSEANAELQVQMDERARAEEQLRQAQKMQALGQLTGGIAHDFNNLLTVIQGSADILRRPDLPDAKRMRFAEAIVETASRAAALTSQLLAFARRQPLQPEVMDLNTKIRGMTNLLDRTLGERIKVVTELADELCAIEADPAQLEAALLNVAVNARDAMPDGGTLTIRTENIEDAKGDLVCVQVADTGEGMDQEVLDRAYEPFFTTKPSGKGTGLGLSQIHGFAAQSGGRTELISKPGAGTKLRLLVPRADKPLAPAHPAAEPLSGGKSLRVLLVEDNDHVRDFAEHLLADLGYGVVSAASADEALTLLETEPVDIVFSDVVMPDRSGLDLARIVAERRPGLPVVLATGYSEEVVRGAAADLEILSKPYGAQSLDAALRRAMSKQAKGG